MRLPAAIEASGYRLITKAETGSTNDDAAAAARAGDPGRLWIVAERQRAGRGRHGRLWSSPAGNLHASLLLIDPCPPAIAPRLGFLAGLALHEAVAALTELSAPRLGLKWPNDLLLDGAKLAGILLEAHALGGGRLAVVIGIGVNVSSAPEGLLYPAASLDSIAPDLTSARLFEELSGRMAAHLARWSAALESGGDPFPDIRYRWTERAAGLGAPVSIRLPQGERRGVFQGIDVTGRLTLATASGTELIDAGDLLPSARGAVAAPMPTISG